MTLTLDFFLTSSKSSMTLTLDVFVAKNSIYFFLFVCNFHYGYSQNIIFNKLVQPLVKITGALSFTENRSTAYDLNLIPTYVNMFLFFQLCLLIKCLYMHCQISISNMMLKNIYTGTISQQIRT